jgi:uncharacterized protein
MVNNKLPKSTEAIEASEIKGQKDSPHDKSGKTRWGLWVIAGSIGGIFLFIIMAVIAQEGRLQKSKNKNSPKRYPHTFLFEIMSPAKKTIYLLGSVHILKDETYPLDPRIEKAFLNSSRLVVEVDSSAIDNVALQALVLKDGMLKGDTVLENVIGSKSFNKLKLILDEISLPVAIFNKMKPAMAALTLSVMHLQKLGYKAENGIDGYFVKKAKSRKMEIVELETIEGQMALFFNIKIGVAYLDHIINDFGKDKKEMAQMVKFWESGDFKGIENQIFHDSIKSDPNLSKFYKKLFFDRNLKMAKKIKGFLKLESKHFVIVGAGHLVGEKGILNLLKKENYTIKQN